MPVRSSGSSSGRNAVALLRLAYLGVTNAFAILRLLPSSDCEKGAEILVLLIGSPCWSGG